MESPNSGHSWGGDLDLNTTGSEGNHLASVKKVSLKDKKLGYCKCSVV